MTFSNEEIKRLGFTLSRNDDSPYDEITTVVGGMDNVDRAIEEMEIVKMSQELFGQEPYGMLER